LLERPSQLFLGRNIATKRRGERATYNFRQQDLAAHGPCLAGDEFCRVQIDQLAGHVVGAAAEVLSDKRIVRGADLRSGVTSFRED
jgi:hypothetical protein